MTQKTDDFTLYYWPVDGRGHFVRVLFEDTGVKYTEVNDGEKIAKLSYSQGKNESKGFPAFAVPLLHHGDKVIGQTNTVVRYVATKVGLLPVNEIDQFHADQVMANIQDAWSELNQYENKNNEDRVKFLSGRFQLWLSLLSKSLGDGEFHFGNKCSYADLVLWYYLHVVLRILGDDKYNEYVTKNHKNLEALRVRVSLRKGVQTLINKNINPWKSAWKW